MASLNLERVAAITDPGSYGFRLEGQQTASREPIIPMIPGLKPSFAESLPVYLDNNFPGILSLDAQAPKGTAPPSRRPHDWHLKMQVLVHGNECTVLEINSDTRDLVQMAVRDVACRPIANEQGERIWPPSHERNGSLRLGLHQKYDEERKPWWWGSVVLIGDRRGQLLNGAVDHINEVVDRSKLPLFRVPPFDF
jgi:hypothetical protein